MMPRPVKVVIGARMVNRVGGFSMAFLAVLLTESLRASEATAGWIVAAFGLATIPSRLAGGFLLDRIGPRSTILLGLTGCAAAQLGLAAAGSLRTAIVAAVVLGLAYELIEPPTQSMVADSCDDSVKPAMFGLLFFSMTIAAVLAGGIASAVAGFDLRLLFVIDAVTGLACACVIRILLPGATTAYLVSQAGATGSWPWRDRRMRLLLASGTAFTVLSMMAVFGVPLTVAERHLGLWAIGASSVVGALVAAFAQRLLRSERLNARGGIPAMTLGMKLFAVSLGMVAGAWNPWLLMAAAVVSAIADVLVMGHLYAAVARLAPAGSSGRYLAVFGLSWGVATTAAPILLSQGIHRWGTTRFWELASCAAMVLALAQPTVGSACGIREGGSLLSRRR